MKYIRYIFAIQTVLFLALLVCMTLLFAEESQENDYHQTLGAIAGILNTIFLVYEILQILISGKSYFFEFWNYLDLARSYLIYHSIFYDVQDKEVEAGVVPFMFLMLWLKVLLYYMSIFEQIRYMVKMITEILFDIKTFLFILVIFIIADA